MTEATRFTVEEITQNFVNGVNVEFVMAYRYDELLCQAAKTEAELATEREVSRGAYDGLLQANCKIDRLEADVQGLVDSFQALISVAVNNPQNDEGDWQIIKDARVALSKFRGES